MQRTIGIIGCGNMGGAILGGLAKNLKDYSLNAFDPDKDKIACLKNDGITILSSAKDVVENSDIIFLCVKPYLVNSVLNEILPAIKSSSLLLSIAAGVSLSTLASGINDKCPVIRCMPNTPALVGKGVFALCFENKKLTNDHKQEILKIFSTLGMCLELAESKFTAFSALIGAGPAYVFEMMQGLVQAGITLGFQHKESRDMVIALFEGCSKMAENSKDSFIQMRDAVCSPAGLTIAGVNYLDRAGTIGLIVDAVIESNKRGKEMEQ